MASLISKIRKDKYTLSVVLISTTVAILIHFPEIISLFSKQEGELFFPKPRFKEVASEVLFAFFSLLFLFYINTRLYHFNQPVIKIRSKQIVLSFITTLLFSVLLAQGFVYLNQAFDILAIQSMLHHYLHPFRDVIIACVVTGSCYIIYLISNQQVVIIENQQLHAENILSQYEVLKNQLNPHMLFNSLNTLQSLTREDPDKAQEYIGELSRVLRYTLQDNESLAVTLQDEMKFISAYIFLLKMRYEDNLIFDIQVDNSLHSFCLPPMSLQILIENAVKHNEISSRHPLTIRIFTDKEQGVSVSNAIQPKLTKTSGTGIGLANLSKRYRLLFNSEIQISEDTLFTVRIPLINHSL